MVLLARSRYLFNVGGGLTIDAARKGNATRFMNHSNDPITCNVDARVRDHSVCVSLHTHRALSLTELIVDNQRFRFGRQVKCKHNSQLTLASVVVYGPICLHDRSSEYSRPV